MRLQNFVILFLISLSLSFPTISARFFPNISDITPDFLSNNATTAAWDSFLKLAGCHPGETIDGINKLKQYFHYFGYIGDVGNYTDDFDDALESALKTYQKNFNLNESGVLDLGTLNQLMKPRCGNADIVNGTTTMNSGKWMNYSNATSQIHSVAHYTFFPGTPRWPDSKRDLTYAFFPGNELTPEAKDVFARAFGRWSKVIPMTFTEADSFITADITIGFFSGDHGDGEPFDGILGTLAHAFSPPSGRFHLDGSENWVIAGDISTSSLVTAVDLESVAVHEIGHLLGLGHSSVENAIMYPSIPSRTKKVELGEDDINGIQKLYGINPSYNGSSSSTPSIQERETTGSSSGAFSVRSSWRVMLAVGFVILIL